jgi:hypothetical protein
MVFTENRAARLSHAELELLTLLFARRGRVVPVRDVRTLASLWRKVPELCIESRPAGWTIRQVPSPIAYTHTSPSNLHAARTS